MMTKAPNYGGNPYGQGRKSFPARQVIQHPVPVTGVKHKSSQTAGLRLGSFIPAGAA